MGKASRTVRLRPPVPEPYPTDRNNPLSLGRCNEWFEITPAEMHVLEKRSLYWWARVMMFLFSGENIPVFLLTVFAKNEKANLSSGERAALIAAAKDMIEDYRRRK